MSNAVLGLGTLLQLSDGADVPDTVYTSIAEITNITISGVDREAVDVTHHESPNAVRQFIAGLLDGAAIQLALNFLPQHASQVDLADNLTEATLTDIFRNYRIVWPDYGASSFTATVGPTTEEWQTSANHGWLTGQPIRFSTTGTLPASTPQIVVGGTYYLRVFDSDAFYVHPTSADAAAGTNTINFANTGTGTHSIHGGTSWEFSAHVSGFEAAAPVASQLTANPTFKVTGSISVLPEE